MKTAMQELKESLQSINERYHLKGDSDWLMNEVLDLVEKYLEKEKEQMVDFAFFAYQGVSQLSEVPKNLIAESKRIFEANFNRIYNQNK